MNDLVKAAGLLKNMELGEMSKFLTNAADVMAPDPVTKKKVLVGVILGGTALGTWWAIRTWRNYQRENKSDLSLVDWMFFKPKKSYER